MLSRSHIASGLTVGLLYFNFYKQPEITVFVSGIIFGSIIPDIDTEKSWISQTVPGVDKILRKTNILKHRGITHGFTGILAMIALYYYIHTDFTTGFVLGYIMHCVTDSILSLIKVKTNYENDKTLFNIFWIINITLIIYLFYTG